jgi:hypothetical protein
MALDRRSAAALALAAALGAAASPAAADLFVCTDPSGRTITADRPPPECANLPIRELRPDGSVRRVIEPPLTEEQRKARAEKARRDHQEQEARRTQARRDIALMETYASEREIEAARQAALTSRKAMIDRARQRLETFAADRTKLEQEAEFYANRKMPATLERAIEANQEMAQAETRLIAEMEADLKRINQRFDAELSRFRELVLAGARPLARTSSESSPR